MNRRERLILLLAAGGLLTISLEVRYLHRDVLDEQIQGWIPVVVGALAGLACFAAAFGRSLAKPASAILAIGVLSGMVGLYFHTEFKPSAFLPLFGLASASENDREREEEGEERGTEGRGERQEREPPALAPLGISGLCAMALLVAWPAKRSSEGS